MTTAGRSPEVEDRVDATRRPDRRAVMRQNWHHLTFLHWVVPPEQIRPLVPPRLDIDLFEGKAYVGLVPFTMTGVRPTWSPAVGPLSRFHETNVRTYVHVAGRDPGVWFFSLDAANRIAVLAARTWFSLPYFFARMSLSADAPGSAIEYASDRRWPGPRPASSAIRCAPRGAPAPAPAGSLEHFLAERYILYSTWRDRLYQGRVHHTPYPLQPAELLALDETLLAAAGLTRPDEPPLAHYALGVSVEVFPLQRVD
jgi:uncharacterized protein YqjF (DUF2071 family)